MKASPLTLSDLSFLRLNLEVDKEFQGSASNYDFDSTLVKCIIKHSKKSNEENTWWVGIEFGTKSTEEKTCPYLIDVVAVGLFHVSADIPEERREKLVYENGAALVFGAIREMITNISSRSSYGQLQLPTASFMGEFENRKTSEE